MAPIIAATEDKQVMRKMAIYWGVYPMQIARVKSTDEIIDVSVKKH